MSPQDIRRHVWDQLRQKDFRAFDALMPAEVVLQAARIALVPAGAGALHVVNLAWLAVASALHTLENFQAVLDHTLKLVEDGPHYHGSAPERARRAAPPAGPRRRHDPRPKDPATISEEAFAQARQLLPWGFWTALIVLLTERFEEDVGTEAKPLRQREPDREESCGTEGCEQVTNEALAKVRQLKSRDDGEREGH